VTAVALTADGLELLAGTEAGTVEHWAADGGRRRAGFEWGQGPITAVAFSADGSTCAAGTAGGRVIVWDHPG
jgi:WD40 repeat protein